jgi:predicted dehydrogenase
MKVGILGAGGMGNVHARQYRKMPDVELHFFDRDSERGRAFAERWEAIPIGSAEEVFDCCDIIDVCYPTDLHVETGLRAIAAGCAVFMEKPIAGSLEDARRLVAAAEKAGTPFMPGQVVRFFPEFAQGHRLVKEGAVGTPAAARTRRGGLAPKGVGEWFMDHSRSGGVLLDLAVHDFDWLRWTLGEVKSVYAKSLGAQTGKGPDYGLATLEFDSGCVAHVEATWMDPSGFRTTFEVAGSEGIVQFDSRQNASLRTHLVGKSYAESPLTGTDDPYYLELRGFVEAVRSGTEPPVTGYDGLMALSIGLAAVESAKTGRRVAPER